MQRDQSPTPHGTRMPGAGHAAIGPLHIVVCIKAVPKPEEVRVNLETRTLDRGSARTEINPADQHALEMALALRDRYGGRVSLLSMGPPLFIPYLRVGLAMGADDAYLLSDRAFGGADTLATSYTLAKGVERIGRETGGYDLVLCGEESSDGATAQVPPGLAEWLGVPQAMYAGAVSLEAARSGAASNGRRLRVRREIKGGHEVLRLPLPAVLSVATGANVPRFFDPARRPWAAAAHVVVWDAAALAVDPTLVGTFGSATQVAAVEQAGRAERRRVVIRGTPAEEARALATVIRGVLGNGQAAPRSPS
ncbi:MAG: electron transfer flavoprotein subunit beta/FixA family protein [Chloroflexi bacterium]|nr:electron transfer flavoprotein subunit beta/FixA family protein [Chloroflexota bacterium]